MPDWSAEGAAQFYETSVFALQWKGLTPDLSHTLPGIGPTCARKNSEECERAASRVTDPQVCARYVEMAPRWREMADRAGGDHFDLAGKQIRTYVPLLVSVPFRSLAAHLSVAITRLRVPGLLAPVR
jgi:hypothetical protein